MAAPPDPPGRAIVDALDPVLRAAGFAGGQGAESGQVIFCSSFDELSDRCPWLAGATGQRRGAGECTDVIVEWAGDGTVGDVRLEARSLADTLRHLGRDADADAVARLAGRPIDGALETLTGLLGGLFAPTSPGTG